jgi:hypothetical protein
VMRGLRAARLLERAVRVLVLRLAILHSLSTAWLGASLRGGEEVRVTACLCVCVCAQHGALVLAIGRWLWQLWLCCAGVIAVC